MASWRRSLVARILLGLILNLAAIAAATALAFALQLRLKPEWLLAGQAGARLQAAAELIADELARADAARWDDVLRRYGEAYGVEFLLFDEIGRGLGGAQVEVPTEVRLRVQRGPRMGLGRGPRGAGPGPEGRANAESPENAPRPARVFPGRQDGPPHAGPSRAPFTRWVVRAGHPPAFWVGIQLPMADRAGPGLSLVARSRSLWSGGLFLDLWPWIVGGLAALALSALLWLPFVRRLTGDLARLTRQTEAIAAGKFEDRLRLGRGDELGRLSEAINQMAARLADHLNGQRRFLGDAAHELCSPLARLQAAVAILESRQDEARQEAGHLQDIREELDEMAALVEELLAFSRATHGRAVRSEPVPLRELVDRAWNREAPDSAALRNEIRDDLKVRADPALLQRVFANLFRNALRYAGQAGPITASAVRDGDQLVISVADSGPGVSPEAIPRLFEPFYRPEASRSREWGGAGLGLAIVKTCIDACGGTVTARNREPNGFEVQLTLTSA